MKKRITLYCIILFIFTLWWMTPLFLHYMLDGVLLSVWRSGVASMRLSDEYDNVSCDFSNEKYIIHPRTIIHYTGKSIINWKGDR